MNLFVEKIKNIFETKDKKKIYRSIAAIFLAGLILIIAASSLKNEDKANKNDIITVSNTGSGTSACDKFKKGLEAILGQIHGAGKVSLFITFSDTGEKQVIYDEERQNESTFENDSGGGERITEKSEVKKSTVYSYASSSSKTPYVINEILPQITGAVVAAQGAGDPVIKNEILNAVQAATGLPAHKISIVKKK